MNEREERIAEIEGQMSDPDFWLDKNRAQELIKELQVLKNPSLGYDGKEAIMTLFAGAGGDDAEDFARMLYDMYEGYFKKRGWHSTIMHQNQNDHGGFRNITLHIEAKGSYGVLKNESGVHRLVRISPFNAKKMRHTSFAMVEVIPKFEKLEEEALPEDEVEVEFTRSSGPGGQNVNKRETAVRVVHIPTKLSAHSESERSQAQNKEMALKMLAAKVYRAKEDERIAKEKGMYVSKTTAIEWGNQIRSYVLHPYKMVKDHRTEVEVNNTEKVLEGDIEVFLEAERGL
jgi:peptide chain release factor 2